MIGSTDFISVEESKKKRIWRTTILKGSEDGELKELQGTSDKNNSRSTYLLKKGSSQCIFKTVYWPISNKQKPSQAREEYDLLLKGSELSDGIEKPLGFKEIQVKGLDKNVFEALYEYSGETLDTMVEKLDWKTVINYMGSVAGIMASLEARKITCFDIKPKNIAVMSGVVKIV